MPRLQDHRSRWISHAEEIPKCKMSGHDATSAARFRLGFNIRPIRMLADLVLITTSQVFGSRSPLLRV